MSTASGPVRPPRSVKRQQESSGLLMSVIRTLSSSQNNEQRDREKSKLEKEFKRSDQRLDNLVAEHQEALQITMQAFSKIASRITSSREKIQDVKGKLTACKMLLHCKRDELKKLWLEGIEHKHVLFLLEQIEALKDISQKVDEAMDGHSYLQATELLVQAGSLLDGSLEGVEALKDLRAEVQGKKDNLYEVLLDEIDGHIYKASSLYLSSLKNQSMKNNFPSHQVDKNKQISLITIVQCLHKLNRISDAMDNVKDRCQSQLLSVVRTTVKQHYSESIILQNIQSSNLLNEFLKQIFVQFKDVIHQHQAFLDNIRKVIVTDSQNTDVHLYSIAEIWSKVQAVIETVIGEYLDIGNTSSGRQPAHPVFTETSADIATFFARKRNVKPKKYSLFRFDSSSHAININNYLKEQKQEQKEAECGEMVGMEEHKLVCEPNPRNITVIYEPCMKYVAEIEQTLQYSAGNHCPLHSFLMDCVKVFVGQISENITNNIESTTKSSDAWKPFLDPENTELANLSRPLLQSTVVVDRILVDLHDLIVSLPVCTEEFIQLMFSVLRNYKETCLDAYRGIVQPESEDKRIISATWAKDEDISRLLKDLPNWINVKQKKWNGESEESLEEVQLRNTRESQILTGSLGDVLIPKHEILSDISQLKLLGHLQESMEWFANRIADFTKELQDHSKKSSPQVAATFEESDFSNLSQLAADYQDISDTCLLVLHLEVRVHCFYHVQPIIQQGSFASGIDMQEPDPEVLKLNKDLCALDEALNSSLQPRKCRYVFEGLGHLISNMIISGIQQIKRINENGIKKMCRNIFAIQQNLTNITMCREVGLDRARQCFELMYFSLQEIIESIVEHGAQFTHLEYTNIMNLIHRSVPGNDQAELDTHLHRLNDLLCDGAVTV